MNNQKESVVYTSLNFLIRTCVNISELKKCIFSKGNMLISQLEHSAFWGESSAQKWLSQPCQTPNKKHQIICVLFGD